MIWIFGFLQFPNGTREDGECIFSRCFGRTKLRTGKTRKNKKNKKNLKHLKRVSTRISLVKWEIPHEPQGVMEGTRIYFFFFYMSISCQKETKKYQPIKESVLSGII